jgi:hypothetical protein
MKWLNRMIRPGSPIEAACLVGVVGVLLYGFWWLLKNG